MLIIYSGGLDSTTLLYEYRDKIKLALSFDYGAKHSKRELMFAKYHCRKLKIEHITIKLDFINKYFNSNLLKSGGEIPNGCYSETDIKKTVVPFRNGIMLSIAIGIAESRNLKNVLIANHSGDHTIYPDCRNTFIHAINEASAYGTYNNVNVLSPYVNLTKRDIALIGRDLKIDYSKTWSCYKGQDIHCGVCATCLERKEALNGFDNTIYKE